MKGFGSRNSGIAIRIWAAAGLCVAVGVHAQTIHKNVDAEGRTTYSDQPGEAPAADVRQGSRFMSTRRSAEIDANEARLRLVRAQIALERAADAAPVLQREVDQAQLRVQETRGAVPPVRNVR